MKIKKVYKYEDDNIYYHLMILKLKKTTYKIILIEDFNLQALIKQEEEEYISTYFYKDVGNYNALNVVGYNSYFLLDEYNFKTSNKKITNKINKYIANNSCN